MVLNKDAVHSSHLESSVSLMTPLGKVERILEKMRSKPNNVSYADLYTVCERYFGAARQGGTSHAVFTTPWRGDPRVNIQNEHGRAKA